MRKKWSVDAAGAAVYDRSGVHWLGDCARAVGDSQGLGSSNGVGNAIERKRCGLRANRGVGVNDNGSVGHIAVCSRGGSGQDGGSEGE